MLIRGQKYETIWMEDPRTVCIIDQRFLPHELVIGRLKSADDVVCAIKEMHLRGAPLIGAAAAFGIYLAAIEAPQDDLDAFMAEIGAKAALLRGARPTAVNLSRAVSRSLDSMKSAGRAEEKIAAVLQTAENIVAEEREHCQRIGEHGVGLIKDIHAKTGRTVNILTHCNAGWLACIDYGTATAPIYEAARLGIPVHVWVDETRPRNQGSLLTAFELLENGIDHTVIADNTGGQLMQRGMVDMVIVGADRVTGRRDTANKIGTYLKALAARDNRVPFYVALTASAFDFSIEDGQEIPIEERSPDEVKFITGIGSAGRPERVMIAPEGSPALNVGFDITPARLITGLITERGICRADIEDIRRLFPD